MHSNYKSSLKKQWRFCKCFYKSCPKRSAKLIKIGTKLAKLEMMIAVIVDYVLSLVTLITYLTWQYLQVPHSAVPGGQWTGWREAARNSPLLARRIAWGVWSRAQGTRYQGHDTRATKRRKQPQALPLLTILLTEIYSCVLKFKALLVMCPNFQMSMNAQIRPNSVKIKQKKTAQHFVLHSTSCKKFVESSIRYFSATNVFLVYDQKLHSVYFIQNSSGHNNIVYKK